MFEDQGISNLQSFAAGEVTPEQAFEIGKATARKMWGDRYQVLVTVHLNTDNVHCHFVVNPVSFKDGAKFQNKIGDHKELRKVSDAICQEHGLSVLENSSFYGGHKKDYWRHKSGKKTHRDYLREDVEYCLTFATSPREFENQLYALGYTLDPVRFSVKAKHWERSVRLVNIGFAKEIVQAQLDKNAVNRYRLFTLEYRPPYKPKKFPLEDELRKLDFSIEHSYDTAVVLVDTVFYLVITAIQIVAELADVMLLSPDLRAAEKDLKELVADYHFLQEHGKTRYANPEDKWMIFKDVHEPIIDREVFEQVQKLIGKTRRRNPKPENWERNMFCDLLYCADCGRKLWFNIKHDKEDIPFFMCGNYHGNRGTCSSTHYLRADAIEQLVMLELRRLSKCLCDDEESFATLLANKTNADILKEKKHIEGELQKCIVRSGQVAELCIRCYEDNVAGKLSDEMFMRFSQKYETERLDLKEKISAYRKRLSEVDEMQLGKEKFMAAVRKFMQMDKLTAPLLQELIDRIDVYEVTGTGKNRKQMIKIHYKFVGYLELPSLWSRHNYREETRKGVAVEYVPNAQSA